MPNKLVDKLNELAPGNGCVNRDRVIQKLLRDAVIRERQKQVAQLYSKRKKTLRQCAELLGVDLEELMNIFYGLNVPLSDEISPQTRLTLKLIRQKKPAKLLD